MGARGPVPNREEDLARPRSRKGSDQQPVTKGEMRPVKIPNADRDWHPIARRLWDSLKTSGQADFYQNSDWAFAYSLCEDLSHYKKSGKRSGQMLQTIYSAFERLLVAEGDRRRVRIELNEPEDEQDSAAVLAIADYKKELGLAQ
ncbi:MULTISPECIES: phage terminase small subunit [Streptomyces]|uniref:phage terminase small subunit n=1 Tax=Streptomyces TaxID=1883 RepID=UPI0036C8FB38